jgi:hypothetical protein
LTALTVPALTVPGATAGATIRAGRIANEPGIRLLVGGGFVPSVRSMKYHVLLLLAAVSVGGCARGDVKPLGPSRPAKPIGCAVAFFAKGPPTYEHVDIATVQTRCRYSTSRIGCADELRAQACALGGDTVYHFARAATRDYTLVSAKVAYRRGGPEAPPAAAALCSPACGPGLKCEDGECVPTCSPNCSQTQICQVRKNCGIAE